MTMWEKRYTEQLIKLWLTKINMTKHKSFVCTIGMPKCPPPQINKPKEEIFTPKRLHGYLIFPVWLLFGVQNAFVCLFQSIRRRLSECEKARKCWIRATITIVNVTILTSIMRYIYFIFACLFFLRFSWGISYQQKNRHSYRRLHRSRDLVRKKVWPENNGYRYDRKQVLQNPVHVRKIYLAFFSCSYTLPAQFCSSFLFYSCSKGLFLHFIFMSPCAFIYFPLLPCFGHIRNEIILFLRLENDGITIWPSVATPFFSISQLKGKFILSMRGKLLSDRFKCVP